MGRPAKRTESSDCQPIAKKAKTVDPVDRKVENLLQVFEEKHQVGILGLPKAAKRMMQAVIPLALGTSSDKRHTYQAQMVDSVGGVLQEVVKTWEVRVAEAESNIKSEESAEAHTQASIQGSEATLETKRLEEAQASESLAAAEEAATEALSKCTAAQEEVEIFDVELRRQESERGQMQTLLETNFQALKSGQFRGVAEQRKLMVPVNLMLSRLDADECLVASLALALARKPDARGLFANLSIDHLEKMMQQNLKEADELIANSNNTKAEKVGAAEEAKKEMEAAEAHKLTCPDPLTKAVEARQLNEAELRQLKQDLKDHKTKFKELRAQLVQNQSELKTAEENLATFDFLREHVVEEVQPEAIAEEIEMQVDVEEDAADDMPAEETMTKTEEQTSVPNAEEVEKASECDSPIPDEEEETVTKIEENGESVPVGEEDEKASEDDSPTPDEEEETMTKTQEPAISLSIVEEVEKSSQSGKAAVHADAPEDPVASVASPMKNRQEVIA